MMVVPGPGTGTSRTSSDSGTLSPSHCIANVQSRTASLAPQANQHLSLRMSSTPPSSNNSGGAPTPPPGAGAPSPLTIGKSFLKQYYQVLTTKPEFITKFYKPSSVLSHGSGSNPAPAVTLAAFGGSAEVKDRILGKDFVVELENGAIDAQESVGGGILLLVTGHMISPSHPKKTFCHSFFLNPILDANGRKRNYYVHNDVLRFLGEVATTTTGSGVDGEEAEILQDTTADESEPAEAIVTTSGVEETKEEEPDSEPAVEESKEEAVEESKDELEPELQEEAIEAHAKEAPKEDSKKEVTKNVAAAFAPKAGEMVEGVVKDEKTSSPKDSARKRDRKSRRNKSRSSSPIEKQKAQAKPKPQPGSWAAMVAGSAGGPSTTATTPTTETATKPATKTAVAPTSAKTTPKASAEGGGDAHKNKSEKEKTDSDETPKQENKKQDQQSSSPQQTKTKRDPECTLVIKNILETTKESDVRGLFESFATAAQAKIVGITVATNRALAFVDYDSPAPVAAALELQQTERFTLLGRNLDVEQKSVDRVNRGFSRSSSRAGGSGRQSNNSRNRGSGGGGRGNGGRGGSGGGNRGGGGSGSNVGGGGSGGGGGGR